MPRRFFKKFALKGRQVGDNWALRPFKHLLSDHRLWGIRRKTVVPAFALGAFFAFMPFPGHPILATVFAIWRKVNVPVAVVVTFISNPVTMPVIYYFCYRVGVYLLGVPPQPFEFELSFQWLGSVFLDIWAPMLLGCITVASVASLVAYAVLDLLWRRSIAVYLSRRRAKRLKREAKLKATSAHNRRS